MLVTIAASTYLQCLITLHRSNHKSRLGLDRFDHITPLSTLSVCLMHMPVVHSTLKTLLQDLSLQAALPPQPLSQAEVSNATEIKVGGGGGGGGATYLSSI